MNHMGSPQKRTAFFRALSGNLSPPQGKKKTPEHYLLDGVFEKSLAAAYFPT